MHRSTLALLAGIVLVVATGISPAHAAVETPAYCGSNPKFAKTLPTDREIILTERKLWFHGTTPSGEVDVRQNENNLFMDETAPTSSTPKEKINLGAAANPASNKNSLVTYWVGELDEEERIVCGAFAFHAASTETFSTALFVDQPRGAATASFNGSATTAGADPINEYQGTLGSSLDVVGSSEIVIQMLAATAAPVFYDSTTHNGSFTYLTVQIGDLLPQ
jgi:hypothetical protein